MPLVPPALCACQGQLLWKLLPAKTWNRTWGTGGQRATLPYEPITPGQQGSWKEFQTPGPRKGLDIWVQFLSSLVQSTTPNIFSEKDTVQLTTTLNTCTHTLPVYVWTGWMMEKYCFSDYVLKNEQIFPSEFSFFFQWLCSLKHLWLYFQFGAERLGYLCPSILAQFLTNSHYNGIIN